MSIPLAVLTAPLVTCPEGARCCRYVAVGIHAPARPRYATDILWYLYQPHVKAAFGRA